MRAKAAVAHSVHEIIGRKREKSRIYENIAALGEPCGNLPVPNLQGAIGMWRPHRRKYESNLHRTIFQTAMPIHLWSEKQLGNCPALHGLLARG